MASITSPIPGKIIQINVKVGQAVTSNDEVFIIDAMKMENPIFCDGGTIKEIKVSTGDTVNENDVLAVLE